MPSKKYNRTKGHDFEREIAKDFREIGYPEAKRNLEYNEGDTGIDLVGTGVFDVQCKRRKSYVSINTIFEIKGEGIPLLITKANGREAMAVIPWKFFKRCTW
jgi:Holliday junction resolvase